MMAIDRFAFEVGFRRLESVYGATPNPQRMAVYLEELGRYLTAESWQTMVQRAIHTRPQFPRVCELLEMLPRRNDIKSHRFNEQDWINNDCTVKECIEGVIWPNGLGNGVMRCPRCGRGSTGYNPYKGAVSLRGELEMEARRLERLEIARKGSLSQPDDCDRGSVISTFLPKKMASDDVKSTRLTPHKRSNYG